jgi:hypothetical protein
MNVAEFTTALRSQPIWWFTLMLASAAASILMLSIPLSKDAASVMCDKAVATLLNTRDLVELTRADILIRSLNCSISPRLPKP